MMPPLHLPGAMRNPGRQRSASSLAAWWVAAWASLVVLLVQLPAHWAALTLNHLSQGRVLLLEARGTLWQGSAFLALSAGPGGGPVTAWQQRVQWQLAPSAMNEITLSLSAHEDTALTPWVWHVRWVPSGWQIVAGNVDWGFPSQWLTGLGTPWNTVEPTGLVRIASPGWQWQQVGRTWQSQGKLSVTLLNFATRLSSLKPLGDYQLLIDGTPNLHVDLKTLKGPLQLTGHGIWHDGRLKFEGEAWAQQTQDEPVLSNLLGVLGTRNGSRAILKVG